MGHPTQHEDARSGHGAKYVGPKSMIDRNQYIRLLEQALRGLGFESVASELERVSVRDPRKYLVSDCLALP